MSSGLALSAKKGFTGQDKFFHWLLSLDESGKLSNSVQMFMTKSSTISFLNYTEQ